MEPNIIHNINYHELAQEVKTRKEKSPEASHKEIISTIVAEKSGPIPVTQVPPPVTSQPASGKPDDSVLPAYARGENPNIKNIVEHLVTLTLQKGIEEGISYAKKEDPFILDAYHDSLSDVLLEELKKRKLI